MEGFQSVPPPMGSLFDIGLEPADSQPLDSTFLDSLTAAGLWSPNQSLAHFDFQLLPEAADQVADPTLNGLPPVPVSSNSSGGVTPFAQPGLQPGLYDNARDLTDMELFSNPSRAHSRGSGSSGAELPSSPPAPAGARLGRVSASSGSGGPAGDAKLARQVARLKDKNRRAQKRYREKQKAKAQSTESKIEELSRQLEEVRVQNSALTGRNNVLEMYYKMHQDEQKGTCPLAPGAAVIGGAPEPTVTGGCPKREAWWMDDATKAALEREVNLEGNLEFTVRGTPFYMTRQQVAGMPPAEFSELWKEYHLEGARLLIDARGDPNSKPAQRLGQLMKETGLLKYCIILSDPERVFSFLAGSWDDASAKQEVPTRDTWERIVRGLDLTQEQRRNIVKLRSIYLQHLAGIVGMRKQLSAGLQAAMPAGAGGFHQTTREYRSTIEMVERLRMILVEEHTLRMKCMMTMRGRIFTTFQMAHMFVQSYPWSSDTMAIINIVAEEQGEPTVTEYLDRAIGEAAASNSAVLSTDPEVGAAALQANLKLTLAKLKDSTQDAIKEETPMCGC